MMNFQVVFVFCAVLFVTTKVTTAVGPMEKHGVVPDVISVVPEDVIGVTYPDGSKADLGNELTPTQVKDTPTVAFNATADSLYTLSMSDPDAPSRADPKYGEWQHWLVVNIPGADVSKGEVVNEYIGAGPPPKTGLHRYVFLVYKQSGKLSVSEPKSTKKSGQLRPNFKIKDFAAKYNLGQPIAGNFFQAQWDDYVPTLYKQLED